MFSLVKYGLSRCNGGFGTEWTHCTEGDFTRATAHLSFSMTYAAPEGERRSLQGEDPKWTHAKNVVNKLATVLTSGRLSAENKELISQAYYSKLNDTSIDDPSGSALRFAQQLLLTTPEFHTNNLVSKTGAARAEPDPPTQTNGTSYKAIVYVMFGGGCDSFNMLVVRYAKSSLLYLIFPFVCKIKYHLILSPTLYSLIHATGIRICGKNM